MSDHFIIVSGFPTPLLEKYLVVLAPSPDLMVWVAGFEPASPSSKEGRLTRLSHTQMVWSV
jgi:hypothetical protein